MATMRSKLAVGVGQELSLEIHVLDGDASLGHPSAEGGRHEAADARDLEAPQAGEREGEMARVDAGVEERGPAAAPARIQATVWT